MPPAQFERAVTWHYARSRSPPSRAAGPDGLDRGPVPSDPHAPVATRQGLDPPAWRVYNPADAQVILEQISLLAEAAMTQRNMTSEQAGSRRNDQANQNDF